ncbi:solute carrier family 23 protein [Castellaniella sp.]|uniref:solute carrier family 23 protein n=1 Tax=Castellaniella sp. TaxID=1955812 RepID=UPI00355DB2B3
MTLLSRLRLPASPPFRRPHDLVYADAECPPTATLFGLGVQHMATALALIAYVLAAAQIGELDGEATRSLVTATILSMALATFLQSWGGKLGAGLLLVHIPDPILVLVIGLVTARYGLGGLVLVGLVNGLVSICAGYLMPYLRALLPPTVAGVAVCVAGLSLITPGLEQIGGMDGHGQFNSTDVLVGLVTLAVIMVLSIWGNRRSKLFALLAGLFVGVVLAGLLGHLQGFEQLAAAPVFDLPSVPAPNFAVDPTVLIAIAVLSLMTQLDVFGCVVLLHKMNDSDWRRPDMQMIGAGMRANGLGNLLAGGLGAYPSAVSSANIALAHISRTTSRWVGLMIAALLALAAFLPQFTLALTLIPRSIIGAVGLYAAAYLIVSGIELIASRALDARGIFMVGLSFVAGLGVMFDPGLAEQAPEPVRFIASNGIIVAGLTAIILNLIFRLGISQHARLALADIDHAQMARAITDFVEGQGAAWNARRDVVRRAAQAALEAAEAIVAAGNNRRLLEIKGSFDEFNLDFEFTHDGAPLPVSRPETTVDAGLLELDDDAFEAAMARTLSGVSGVLLRRLADNLKSGQRGDTAYLQLHFAH